jgi:dihydropteroate synthase
VAEEEELRRVMPVLERLHGRINTVISIDTYKPRVAREAIAAGACLVNDIAAGRQGPEMWNTIAATGAGYVVMHMQGVPQTMQVSPSYQDVSQEVASFFEERIARLAETGVNRDQILLDVGIGFGKTPVHNLQLLADLRKFTKFGRPLVLGVSRKSFLASGGVDTAQERLPAALGISAWAVAAGVAILRTHDVRATLQAVRITEEILSHTPPHEISPPKA